MYVWVVIRTELSALNVVLLSTVGKPHSVQMRATTTARWIIVHCHHRCALAVFRVPEAVGAGGNGQTLRQWSRVGLVGESEASLVLSNTALEGCVCVCVCAARVDTSVIALAMLA
jgi:hypothetical protein